MLTKFNEILGCGEEGTVATEHLVAGPRRHPRGIPKLTLVAALLDLRMKEGVGIPAQDHEYLFRFISKGMLRIAMAQNIFP